MATLRYYGCAIFVGKVPDRRRFYGERFREQWRYRIVPNAKLYPTWAIFVCTRRFNRSADAQDAAVEAINFRLGFPAETRLPERDDLWKRIRSAGENQ